MIEILRKALARRAHRLHVPRSRLMQNLDATANKRRRRRHEEVIEEARALAAS